MDQIPKSEETAPGRNMIGVDVVSAISCPADHKGSETED
jgi:hypothetical protein